MNSNSALLNLAKRVQSLSENGQHFANSEYDLDRYNELGKISSEMISLILDTEIELLTPGIIEDNGYKTAKVDVRAVVFNDLDEILMIRETIDGKWSLPGGWADVGFTPAEIAVKETAEEAGIIVEAKRLLAVFDKKCHDHPPDVYYAYKIFIECSAISETLNPGFEASDAGFFPLARLPELSLPRNTRDQISIMFDYRMGKRNWPYIDL